MVGTKPSPSRSDRAALILPHRRCQRDTAYICPTGAMTTPRDQTHDPMHGMTLERILNELVAHFGWKTMGERIRIRCFRSDPSVASSLKFLRKTPWAREKVEAMYLRMVRERSGQSSTPG
jgi:hypothetical protein